MSNNKPVVRAEDQRESAITQLVAGPDEQPVVLATVLQEMGLAGPRIPAEQLKYKKFKIVRAKPFMSSYDESKQCYFCVIYLEGDSNPYTTVLGGGAVVDIIQAYIASGGKKPLMVMLDFIEGGRWGGYYQLS